MEKTWGVAPNRDPGYKDDVLEEMLLVVAIELQSIWQAYVWIGEWYLDWGGELCETDIKA